MRTGENIYKRKDGRWEARYRKGRKPDGKLQYGSCYGKTYSEAKKKAAEFARRYESIPQMPAGPAVCFSSLCESWLSGNRLRLKESTYVKYQTVIEKYLIPYFGTRSVTAMEAEQLRQFAEQLLQEHQLAPKTVRDVLLILHGILVYAKKCNPEMPVLPEISYPKDVRKELRVLSRAEQAVLTEYLLQDINTCKFGVLLALWTGIRIGELCALRWDHIDLEEATLKIDLTMQRLRDTRDGAAAKTRIVMDAPKSDCALRTIPLTQQAAALCRQMAPEDSGAYLLTGSSKYMEPRILQYHFNHYAKDCNLNNVHFHTLRHTFATRCVEVGFDVKTLSEILGHANISITLNRYVHCSMDFKRSNIRKLEAMEL